MRRHPDGIAQVFGRIDVHLGQAAPGQPVVAAVDDGLQRRAQAAIGIGDPGEGLVIGHPRGGRGRLERLGAQLTGCVGIALALAQHGFDQQRHPGLGLAEQHRHLLAGKHLHAQGFTGNRLAVGLHHRQCAGVEFQRHIQLVQRPLPLACHTKQLEQEDPQLGVLWVRADLLGQQLQGAQGVAVLEGLFCGAGIGHRGSASGVASAKRLRLSASNAANQGVAGPGRRRNCPAKNRSGPLQGLIEGRWRESRPRREPATTAVAAGLWRCQPATFWAMCHLKIPALATAPLASCLK